MSSPKSSAVSFLQSTPGGSAPSAEGTGGITEITNQMADLDIRDAGSFDENMESFLSHDGGDGNIYGILKHEAESSKGFSEFGCIQTINKVTSCHFSSDGKLLASAGHDKRAVFWNVDTLQSVTTPEEHRYLITDIRFRPNSTQVATASFDKSVRLWDAANVVISSLFFEVVFRSYLFNTNQYHFIARPGFCSFRKFYIYALLFFLNNYLTREPYLYVLQSTIPLLWVHIQDKFTNAAGLLFECLYWACSPCRVTRFSSQEE